MNERYGVSADPEENLARARYLWRLATDFERATPAWNPTSKAGRAHTVAAAALYGLSQAISEVAGYSLLAHRSAKPNGVENALHENLLELVRTRGPQVVAELAYQLADGIAAGVAASAPHRGEGGSKW